MLILMLTLSWQNTGHATFLVSHNNVDMYTQCYSGHRSKTSSKHTKWKRKSRHNVNSIKKGSENSVRLLYHYYIKLGHVINENDKASSILLCHWAFLSSVCLDSLLLFFHFIFFYFRLFSLFSCCLRCSFRSIYLCIIAISELCKSISISSCLEFILALLSYILIGHLKMVAAILSIYWFCHCV